MLVQRSGETNLMTRDLIFGLLDVFSMRWSCFNHHSRLPTWKSSSKWCARGSSSPSPLTDMTLQEISMLFSKNYCKFRWWWDQQHQRFWKCSVWRGRCLSWTRSDPRKEEKSWSRCLNMFRGRSSWTPSEFLLTSKTSTWSFLFLSMWAEESKQNQPKTLYELALRNELLDNTLELWNIEQLLINLKDHERSFSRVKPRRKVWSGLYLGNWRRWDKRAIRHLSDRSYLRWTKFINRLLNSATSIFLTTLSLRSTKTHLSLILKEASLNTPRTSLASDINRWISRNPVDQGLMLGPCWRMFSQRITHENETTLLERRMKSIELTHQGARIWVSE